LLHLQLLHAQAKEAGAKPLKDFLVTAAADFYKEIWTDTDIGYHYGNLFLFPYYDHHSGKYQRHS
jgi:hypothetical protein